MYTTYHQHRYLGLDPLVCVHGFSQPRDREVGGFICSALAYGRVESIVRSLKTVFAITSEGPAQFAVNTTFSEKKRRLAGFKHRFNDSEDVAMLFETLGKVLRDYGSIETGFVNCMNGDGIKEGLGRFVQMITTDAESVQGRKKSFEYLVPSPLNGSACKRLALYLRWMVRDSDGIDLGLWKRVSASKLIFPVDTHVARVASFYGITERKSADWRMAEEITAFFRRIDPQDPVKYDFSMCRAGMIDFRKGVASVR